ncbi:hypothetical protein [Streptomyces sp. 7N604]|uniref:hypothetical protein n=1 Tax=Streptomyces sp. 7N604 TaxID=3457415 RepID=UPI003FD349F5
MPPITRIDQIPTSHAIFPPDSYPDLEHPGAVHHGWNTGRQLLLLAQGSAHSKTIDPERHPERVATVHLLRTLRPLDNLSGPMTIALYIAAVSRPHPNAGTESLRKLMGEAVADLGDWGIRAPEPDQVAHVALAVDALTPCMPD